MQLVYRHERPLAIVAAVISALVWIALIIGTMGTALIYLLFYGLFYLFAQSGFIA